jgi:hypothetical protein
MASHFDFKLRTKELLHILKRKPKLNKQLNSQSNFDIKTLISAAYPQFRKCDVLTVGTNPLTTLQSGIFDDLLSLQDLQIYSTK